MDKEMKEIKDAIIQADFELLKILLTDKTPESCSKVLHLSFHNEWCKSCKSSLEPIPVEVKEAYETKSREILQIFLDHGADVNYTHDNESTFSLACNNSSASIVKMMIDHGADMTTKTSKYNLLPIEIAFVSRDADKINLFLDLGIDATEINRLNLLHDAAGISIEIVKRLVKLGADVNKITNGQRTAILCAVESKDLEVVKFLIECGANLNITDGSILEAAVLHEDLETVRVLLENGANANLGWWIFPLIGAIKYILDERKSLEMVKLLLQHGANIDGPAEDLKSPICTAARRSEEIVKLLLDKEARQDDNALIRAVESRRYEIVKMLLERGYNPNCKGYIGYSGGFTTKTALSWAVGDRNKELVQLLLNYGAQVDGVIDEGGKTPLHFAVGYNCKEIVQLLLSHGANINAEYHGQTALTLAIARQRQELMDILTRHIIFKQSLGLKISQVNLDAINFNESLAELQDRCTLETGLLGSQTYDNSTLSYMDILKVKDNCALAALANNQNIVKIVESNDFIQEYPIYGNIIVDCINKAISKRKDFELIKRFIKYLWTRDHDQLPQLPFTVAHQIFSYLVDGDFATLRNL